MDWAASLPLFGLTALATMVIGALAGVLAVVAVRRRVLGCDPCHRHRALVVLAALPASIGATLLLSAALPPIVALVIPALDHCGAHDDVHAHLCFRHAPDSIPSWVQLTLLAAVAIATTKLVRTLVRLRRASRVLRTLIRSGDADATLDVTIVETPLPICMTVGLLHPRIVIARELLAGLAPQQREIVLAHERAHSTRRDTLSMAVARALGSLHLPSVARWISTELDIAAEQACDEAAAERVGDRVAVAATILAMRRAWLVDPGTIGALGHGFAMQALERRVRALLAEPLPPDSLAVHRWCLLSCLALVLACAGALHHWTESAVSHVAL